MLNLEILSSWYFKHFLASQITVYHGVWHGWPFVFEPGLIVVKSKTFLNHIAIRGRQSTPNALNSLN
jgi:hypothetical protein